MDEEIILGQICDTWLAGTQQVALLEPLYVLDKDTGDWLKITDPEQKFPNRGRVTWVKPVDEAIRGSVWTFTYDSHPNFDPGDRKHDRYRINWSRPPEQPIEVLGIHASNLNDALRKVEHGLSLRFVPTRHVYIVLDDQSWAGPVKLVQEHGRWVLDPHHRNLPVPQVSALAKEHLVSVNLEGWRTFLRHNAPPLTRIGELDWSSDKVVLQRLLKEASKNPEFARASRLTKATIQQIVETLTDTDAGLTAQRLARARAYLADAERLQAEFEAFQEELLALPAVAERIARAEQEGRESARVKAETETIARARAELDQIRQEHAQLASAIAEQRATLEELERKAHEARLYAENAVEAEMRKRKAELSELNSQIAERRRQLDDQIALADATVTAQIAELAARPAEALAQIALVRAALGPGRAERTVLLPHLCDVAPPTTALRNGENTEKEQDRLVKTVRHAFLAAGLPGVAAVAIHGALVAGMVPLVGGPGALEALERYAHVATGGRIVWVNVTATTLEPADLLGRHDPHTGRFLPHPSGLLDLLIYATKPEQREHLFLVVLDGVNRAAVDSYLQPLLACYRSSWCEESARKLRLAHPAVFGPDDPYAQAGELAWPANVLLAGTLIDGVATVPLPSSLWSDALYVDIGSVATRASHRPDSVLQRSSVSLQDWLGWHSQIVAETQTGLEVLSEFNTDGVRLPARIAHGFARIFTAIRPHLPDDNKALQVVVRGLLTPYALGTQQEESLRQVLEVATIGVDAADLDMLRQVLL